MKLKEYLNSINKKVREDPSILDLECYYTEDESKSVSKVRWYPNIGYIDRETSPSKCGEVLVKRVLIIN